MFFPSETLGLKFALEHGGDYPPLLKHLNDLQHFWLRSQSQVDSQKYLTYFNDFLNLSGFAIIPTTLLFMAMLISTKLLIFISFLVILV